MITQKYKDCQVRIGSEMLSSILTNQKEVSIEFPCGWKVGFRVRTMAEESAKHFIDFVDKRAAIHADEDILRKIAAEYNSEEENVV